MRHLYAKYDETNIKLDHNHSHRISKIIQGYKACESFRTINLPLIGASYNPLIELIVTGEAVQVTHKVKLYIYIYIGDVFIKLFRLTYFTLLMTDEENSRYGLVADTDESQGILKLTFNMSQISYNYVACVLEKIRLMW